MVRDRSTGRAPQSRSGGATHRVGKVRGVLRGRATAAHCGAGPDGDRLAAACPDAEPGRCCTARGRPRRDHPLRQRQRVENHPRRHRRRPARRAADQPRTPHQAGLPREGPACPRRQYRARRNRFYRPQIYPYTPFVLREFRDVPWLFTDQGSGRSSCSGRDLEGVWCCEWWSGTSGSSGST